MAAPPFSPPVDKATAFVALELMNQWVQFARCLYLMSCRGAKDSGGARIACAHVAYVDDNESLRVAANNFRPAWRQIAPGTVMRPRDEPNWLDPKVLLEALRHVGASNEPSVAMALTHQTRALLDLPSVRNFFGHRSKNTAQKVVGPHGVTVRYVLPPVEHPTEFCIAYEPSSPLPVLGAWLEDIRTIEEFACI